MAVRRLNVGNEKQDVISTRRIEDDARAAGVRRGLADFIA